ncbi:DUF523 domain-containing protein [Desulfovibrio subterraneus]|jgi:uncharacterized protein YbbK (DUF523 family)|uniref:Purine nucleoside phosphorylase n=1 Tax=Desulfovibrio subterraneus TaxID=2718620 RepID=A0A7J0BLU9_9BACT|nr:DUF523 domain-containing protein [Desulfovibrio subterraneus]WBF66491.1 DUF523 domain-containing protein [Desulfovibrio subterraneus]GFM34619.1 hypothetical protein DSM101010T_29840 [Desulfovibrio subterraneus]
MPEYVVSACLAGCHCRYDGNSTPDERVMQLVREGRALPVCPEQLGGLPTPRPPFELSNGRAMDSDGTDITAAMLKGVDEAMHLVQLAGCTKAVLKSRSPSCGFGIIYDGTFSGTRIAGSGLFAERLHLAGIAVVTEETMPSDTAHA